MPCCASARSWASAAPPTCPGPTRRTSTRSTSSSPGTWSGYGTTAGSRVWRVLVRLVLLPLGRPRVPALVTAERRRPRDDVLRRQVGDTHDRGADGLGVGGCRDKHR